MSKKAKDRIWSVITSIGLIMALIGAAAMDSEELWLPVLVLFTGMGIAWLSNKLHWHMD